MNDNKGTLTKVEKVADDIRSAGGEAMAMRCDVRNREDIDSVVASTVEEFGQIDILVNAISPSSMTPDADMAKHFDTEEKMDGAIYFKTPEKAAKVSHLKRDPFLVQQENSRY